jgi:nicotinic acid phosphoribosyltransferase
MGMFDTVSDETIRSGECTDIYFERTEETLLAEGINPNVVMEVTASALRYVVGLLRATRCAGAVKRTAGHG